jgi:tetratricopeptide (TPR) repeat protein
LHTTEAAARVISPEYARVPLGLPPPSVRPQSFTELDDAIAWCEAERAGLVAATQLAAAFGLYEIAWKLPAVAMSFYYRRSYWGEWMATDEVGLASARTLGDRRAEAWMLNHLGMAYGVQRMPESIGCFEQALAIYRELGDEQGAARAAANAPQAYIDLGRFEDALSAANRSLAIQRQQGNRHLEGGTLGILGRAYRELDRLAEAVDYLEQALAIFRELGQRYAEADSLTDLGDTFLGFGQVENAIARLSESLVIRRVIGDRHGEAATLHLLGVALQRSGDRPQARDRLIEALRLFESLGDRTQARMVRDALADLDRPAD